MRLMSSCACNCYMTVTILLLGSTICKSAPNWVSITCPSTAEKDKSSHSHASDDTEEHIRLEGADQVEPTFFLFLGPGAYVVWHGEICFTRTSTNIIPIGNDPHRQGVIEKCIYGTVACIRQSCCMYLSPAWTGCHDSVADHLWFSSSCYIVRCVEASLPSVAVQTWYHNILLYPVTCG